MKHTIYAHRGVPSLAPENTIAAFKEINNTNTNWLETDISITQNEELFILHDDYLDRTTSLKGAITETASEEVKKADAGSWYDSKFIGEHVPSLSETIDLINENKLNVNLEIKGVVAKNSNHLADVLVRKLSDEIDRLNPDLEILISSFNPIMLLKLQEYQPNLKYACLFDKETLKDDWNLYLQACNAKVINVENKTLTKEQVNKFKEQGYEVNVWTVNDKKRAEQLFDWGVDGIFTNIAQEF
ncbi:glycerophosphoryl diester phosphodiesterase [Companilactobacillus sp. RD055328]|uniref:glycerophosphodiester phosphodiesterase family protein n=1 Tax=Companilactobacillus sp. RD055328 TaxID=2916634 RepID=UPI001FC85B8B|nr:glycerophosphodiester phosphodiesterase family protein [Companilactobacillus sp. RD055328]GKQ43255.1 glycerophosphoryl diester phosphodiesterase [Companilactobacillus sp. RD055328]